jgi:hypothetical protein
VKVAAQFLRIAARKGLALREGQAARAEFQISGAVFIEFKSVHRHDALQEVHALARCDG